MHIRHLFACALLAGALAARAEPIQYRWNLADLYPDASAWNADAARLEASIPSLAACKGHLGDSAAKLRECLELRSEGSKRSARLAVYANELHAQDTGAPEGVELRQKLTVIGTRVAQASSFMRPEILALGRARIDAFLREDGRLATYRHWLDDIVRAAPHTLDEEGESLIAAYGLAAGASANDYQMLSNADMPWPTVTLSDGKPVKLDPAAFEKYRQAPDREDRKRVLDAYWGRCKEFERTFGVMFYGNLKEDTVHAKVRRYPDSLTAALDGDNVPVAVYDTLVREAQAALPTLHRYFRLRARILGVDQLHYYDVYTPLVVSDRKFPIEQGEQLMLDAVKPLGEAYVAAMKDGLEHRWMDVYPRPRKLAGAHMAGSAYDVHPYLLINYNDDYPSVSTIAHEWGHAMHSYLSNRAQPFVNSRYSIFVAEIASTLNEALLLDHMLKIATTDDERLLYLGSALENLRGTFFVQAMFAQFEREVHARVDRGEPLSGEKVTAMYGDILKRYFGDAEGAVKIDDAYTVQWALIPHFYRDFYVYQYATSIAASSLFADGILEGKPGARERYLKLLSAGGSDYPYRLVKDAGVDLATPAPYRAVAARMNRIMDEIEAILARRENGKR